MIQNKRALLIGRDRNFAWVLEKMLSEFHIRLEHVYTIAEALTRMKLQEYVFYFLDGKKPFEIEHFVQQVPDRGRVIIVDTGEEEAGESDVVFLKKDLPVEILSSSLRQHLHS